eukprot:2017526-Lingulodinium_polyedra.AAC.1
MPQAICWQRSNGATPVANRPEPAQQPASPRRLLCASLPPRGLSQAAPKPILARHNQADRCDANG